MGKQPVPWRTLVKNEICLLSCILTLLLAIPSCSSGPRGRIILDTSTSDKPDWVDSDRLSWKEEKNIFFKGTYAVRGDERTNGCIDLAKLGVKEAVITEIQEELKGALDSAQDSIRADAEIILTNSRSARYQGSISGLRFTSSYWEKYALANRDQRISCFVLGRISEEEFARTKKNVLNKITRANPKLKEAIANKQIKFFEE